MAHIFNLTPFIKLYSQIKIPQLLKCILAVILVSSLLLFTSQSSAVKDLPAINLILIEKSKRSMSIYHQDKLLKKYNIALGASPKGKKEKQGDCKTPEGEYFITSKNKSSRYHLSLTISYPNNQDKENARKLAVSPGDNILIHGIKSHYSWLGRWHTLVDWTLGCVAVTNAEIEEIYSATPIGTKVEIKP